ncbi:MAG: DUF1559 domain-containing protein [Verrucomicrobiae bacterium]|nr:DUF1559 domain-containing protein [Verrucomicrobiae bacterium]
MSRQITCMNNLRQIGLASHAYADENDDAFPIGSAGSPTGSWCYMLAPYLNIRWEPASTWPVSGLPVFFCPSAKPYEIFPSVGKVPLYNLSYGYSQCFYTQPELGGKRSQVSNPSLCLLAADLEFYLPPTYPDGYNMSSYIATSTINQIVNSFGSAGSNSFAYRHSGGLNVLYVDGHVQWTTPRADGFPHGFYFSEKLSFGQPYD